MSGQGWGWCAIPGGPRPGRGPAAGRDARSGWQGRQRPGAGSRVDKAGGRGGAPVGSQRPAYSTPAASRQPHQQQHRRAPGRTGQERMEARRRRPAHRVAIAASPAVATAGAPGTSSGPGSASAPPPAPPSGPLRTRAAPGQLQKHSTRETDPAWRPGEVPGCARAPGRLSRGQPALGGALRLPGRLSPAQKQPGRGPQ